MIREELDFRDAATLKINNIQNYMQISIGSENQGVGDLLWLLIIPNPSYISVCTHIMFVTQAGRKVQVFRAFFLSFTCFDT